MRKIHELLELRRDSAATYVRQGESSISYAETFDLASRNRTLMITAGASESNIMLLIDNSIAYITSYWSASLAGATMIPLNPKLTLTELESETRYCDSNWLIYDPKYAKEASALRNSLGIGLLESGPGFVLRLVAQALSSRRRVNDGEIAVMLHTSGTTGNPKKVMLSHHNLITNLQAHAESLSLLETDRVLIALPLYFGYCNTAQFLVHTHLGGEIVLYDPIPFFPKNFCSLVQKRRISAFTAVPTMLLTLANYKFLGNYDLSSLRYVCYGGGPSKASLIEDLMKKMPKTGFVQTYGQTEAGPRLTSLLPADALSRSGSVGKPIPGVELEIVDEEGRVVAPGVVGEIRARSTGITPGYYKNPEETAKVIKDGSLYTGDLAYEDGDGFLFLVGRKKNLIISGGINIYPEEIEDALRRCDGIQEAYVYGEPDDFLGEKVMAKVTLQENARPEKETLLRELKQRLASYKIPRDVQFVEEFSRTHTGKIRRGVGASV